MAKKKKSWEKIGHYAFFAGIILAIVAGLFTGVLNTVVLMTVLVILGLIVGFLNITVKETTKFLVAAVALMLAGVVNLGLIPVVGIYIRAILSNIVVFVVPAVIIVALQTIWRLAKAK